MFAAVLFDLDNTLIDRDAAFLDLVRDSFDSRETHRELLALDQGGYGSRRELFDRWHELGGEKFDVSTFGVSLSQFLSPSPQLLESLAGLAKTTQIGILTNGGQRSQLAKWRAAKLDQVVRRNRLWISEEMGVAKPAVEAFNSVCQQLNVLPQNCLYVGDQPEIDIAGAQSAGLQTMLVKNPVTPHIVDRMLASEYQI